MNLFLNLTCVGQLTRVAGKLRWVLLAGIACAATSVSAQQTPSGHWLHAGAMPPGAIGRQRLMKRGESPVLGYCQPVEIRAPKGVRIAPAAGGSYGDSHEERLKVGLQIGPVYRFRVSDLLDHPGVQVFPTIELVDRLHPPAGKSLKFPVPVDLTAEELLLAAEGKFVTRIIYVEDPLIALPIAQKAKQPSNWIEARPGEDPLLAAKALGRPIAILRMGGRVPTNSLGSDEFNYGSPQPLVYGGWQQGVEPQPESLVEPTR